MDIYACVTNVVEQKFHLLVPVCLEKQLPTLGIHLGTTCLNTLYDVIP